MSLVRYLPFGGFEERTINFMTTEVRCHLCESPATKLCDYERDGRTCDASLCAKCAEKKGQGIDHCPSHRKLERS